MFIVSHDRWFLDRIATHILAFEEMVMLNGLPAIILNIKEFQERKIKLDEPKKFKPLTR